MKEYLNTIKQIKIFDGLSDENILSAINCLDGSIKYFNKGENIASEGDEVFFVGAILSGELQTQKTDHDGNVNIISKLFPPNLIAAAACYSFEKRLPFDVVAVCDSEILYLNSEKIIRQCTSACVFHSKIISNTLSALAQKNIELSQKIDILAKRSIREKIMSYLFSQSKKSKSKNFSIGLSRQQMAEYLSINRSALSRELCKMRDEGILDFNDNHFSFK